MALFPGLYVFRPTLLMASSDPVAAGQEEAQ